MLEPQFVGRARRALRAEYVSHPYSNPRTKIRAIGGRGGAEEGEGTFLYLRYFTPWTTSIGITNMQSAYVLLIMEERETTYGVGFGKIFITQVAAHRGNGEGLLADIRDRTVLPETA